MPKKVALLIGVSEYGEGIPCLSATPNDVAAMKRVLENPNLGGFSEVQTLINPELVPMQEAIEKLFKTASREDVVLLFFSGHGITNDNNNLFLATRITSKDNFRSTSVQSRFIQEISKESYAKRQIIILDCCYSGAFATGWQNKSVGLDLKKELGAEGRVVLTSSTATQTSFQEEGAELSLYTQYLVEGIETGAADKDGDGKIHASELHQYAKAKVQEVKPKMQPEIISDKEGYDILLSQVLVNKETLKYRKRVEEYAEDGNISDRGRQILKVEQQKYGISDEKAKEIINSVLEPFKKRLDNLADYEKAFREEVERQYPLNRRKEKELTDWQQTVLGLNDEDVNNIHERVLSELEKKQGQQPEEINLSEQSTTEWKDEGDDLSSDRAIDYTRLRDLLAAENSEDAEKEIYLPFSPFQQSYSGDNLSSDRAIDYTRLRDLLATGNWKDADYETYLVMLKVVSREEGDWIRSKELLNFPCTDLRTIDSLWVKYSNGRFGFSVQKKIYLQVGGIPDGRFNDGRFDEKAWSKYGERVGWRVNGNWIEDKEVIFDTTAPLGHLPSCALGRRRVVREVDRVRSFLFLKWKVDTVDEVSWEGRRREGRREYSSLASKLIDCSL